MVFTPANSRQFFRRMVSISRQGDCVLDGVETARSRISIRWKSGADALPAATVEPAQCALVGAARLGPFAVVTPPALTERCPASVQAFRRELSGGALVASAVVDTPNPPRRSRVPLAIAALVALFAVVSAGEWWFARRARSTSR